MQTYDFDKIIDRHGTATTKYLGLKEVCGRDDVEALWIADMDFEVCPEIAEALSKRVSHHIYGYSAPTDNYWQAIIDWQHNHYDFNFTREELNFVPGVVRGIAYSELFFTNPGDKVVIQEPVYHHFRNATEAIGRVIVSNPLIELPDGFYKMDLEGLERIFIEEKPKMMILCNPHNPIGIAWTPEVLRSVASLCKKYGVLVVSDEIHGDLCFYGHKHYAFASVSQDAADVSITFGAPSKTFNIAGLVSSWCVVKNPAIREPFFKWLNGATFSESTFMAVIGAETAYRYGAEWLNQLRPYLEANIDFVVDYCKEHIPGIKALRPEASFLVWLDCRGLKCCHEKVIDLFVNKAHLGLNSGQMFGPAGDCHMRLNVGTPRSVLKHALDSLAQAVRDNCDCGCQDK